MNELQKDFRNFLYVIWMHLMLPPPTKVQYDIANYLQDFSIRRKIIEAFRGIGKSWITSAYVLWRLYRDPEYKALVVSASKGRSDDFTAFTKRLIREVPFLQYLRARANQRDSMVAFDVAPARPAHAPSVKSAGIFGQLSGSRAVEVIADDTEVPNNSYTQDMRDKLLKAVLEFEAIIMPKVGQITYLGTPQTEESVYNKLRSRGYKAKIWPALYPHPDKILSYAGDLADWIQETSETRPDMVGKPTDPLRFNALDLMEREASYGRSGFALQFMLDTTLSDIERYPLKTSDLIIMATAADKAPVSLAWSSGSEYQIKELPNVGFSGDRFHKPMFVDKDWAAYEGSILAIDPSGRGTNDTAYAVLKQLHGKLFARRISGLRGGYEDETLVTLAKIAKEENVNRCIIESNFGDGMFQKILSPVMNLYHKCTIEEVRQSTQKERRIIDTLEPVMNTHRLVVDYDVVKEDTKILDKDINYSLFYQMTHLTKDRGALKIDDKIDVLAIGVQYWLESMARNEDNAADEYRERMKDEELQIFIDHAVGNIARAGNNWINTNNIIRR